LTIRFFITALAVAAAGLLAACAAPASPAPTPVPPPPTQTSAPPTNIPTAARPAPPTPTRTAPLTTTPGAISNATALPLGPTLFQDDFSNPAGAWPITDKRELKISYDTGEYRVIVASPDISSFSDLRDRTFDNVSIEADMRLVSGSSANLFGLLCRATLDTVLQSGYEILIAPSGIASIQKITGPHAGQERILTSGSSNVVLTGNATNHVRAECNGDDIAMYVNGRKLVDVHDSDYAAGQVGFAFGSPPSGSGFEVRFDNFLVRQIAR
jgi:hypothetical protein